MSNPSSHGLLGGADPSAPSDPFTQSLSGFSLSGNLRDRIENAVRSAPITYTQIGIGTTLYMAHLLGVLNARKILFHPRLVGYPQWQTWRSITAFGVLGVSVLDVVRSIGGLIYWQAPLEKWVCGTGDTTREGRIVRRGTNRQNKDGSRKPLFQWLVTSNQFLRILSLSSAILLSIEFVIYKDPTPLATPFAHMAPTLLLFPYALYPLLEHTVRWLWALTDQDQDVNLFGVLPINPVYLPLAMTAIGGFTSWKEMLKGLVTAVGVSYVMKIRRGGEEGELVVDFLKRFGRSWAIWLDAVFRRLSGAVPPAAPAAAPTPVMPGTFPPAGGLPDMAQLQTAFSTAASAFTHMMADMGAVSPSAGESQARRRNQGGARVEQVQMEEIGAYDLPGAGSSGAPGNGDWGRGQRLGS
ncbi:hypothetical protein HDU97_002450 [Phlyctochytrium planicorne]|nr:hypothetical protein HDU97_002450 [Phlyctochytrium planicorne]